MIETILCISCSDTYFLHNESKPTFSLLTNVSNRKHDIRLYFSLLIIITKIVKIIIVPIHSAAPIHRIFVPDISILITPVVFFLSIQIQINNRYSSLMLLSMSPPVNRLSNFDTRFGLFILTSIIRNVLSCKSPVIAVALK